MDTINTTWMTKKETKELKNLFLCRIIFLHQITSTFYSAERECYVAATIIKFFLISGLNVMWELLSIYAYHNSFCQVFLFCKPRAFAAGSVFVSWSIIGNKDNISSQVKHLYLRWLVLFFFFLLVSCCWQKEEQLTWALELTWSSILKGQFSLKIKKCHWKDAFSS